MRGLSERSLRSTLFCFASPLLLTCALALILISSAVADEAENSEIKSADEPLSSSDQLSSPVIGLDCLVTYAEGTLREEVLPWKDSYLPNSNAWVKADFAIPICIDCNCDFARPVDPLYSRGWLLSEVFEEMKKHNDGPILSPEGAPLEPYTINFGAADYFGGKADPTYDLFLVPDMGGLLIDGQTESYMFHLYPKRPSLLVAAGTQISVPALPRYLYEKKVPKYFTALKIDIDSYECGILESMLEHGYRSAIVHIEFNPTLPYPLRFSVNASVDDSATPVWRDTNAFYGCSLARIADIMIPAGYRLIEVDGWDATFVEQRFAKLFEPLPANLPSATWAGFSHRFELVEHCVTNPKIVNPELHRLSLTLIQHFKAGRKDEAQRSLAEIRNVMQSYAPKLPDAEGTMQPTPFLLEMQGASDAFFNSACLK